MSHLLHEITYSRRRGHRTKHRWDCSCGEGGQQRSSVKAQRQVALHLWWTNGDYDPFGGDSIRIAIVTHKLMGKRWRDMRGRYARHPRATLHPSQVRAIIEQLEGERDEQQLPPWRHR